MYDRCRLFIGQIEERWRVPPRNHVDLTQFKLLPVHECERLISLLDDTLVLATGDDFAEEARIIWRRLTAPTRAAGAGWYFNGQSSDPNSG